jgi:glycosyltransferase involved in cell wall biosynthesis
MGKGKAMVNKHYDVILTASNAIAPFPRLERVAECLADLDFRCLAVGWDRTAEHPPVEEKGGFDVLRARFWGRYGGGIRNLYGLLLWNLYLLCLHLKLRPKIIHAYDFDTILPALIARAFINCKVVYDIADWYAGSKKIGYLRLFFEKAERLVCRKADFVILAHEKRLKQLGFIPGRWLAIYNTPEDIYEKLKATEDGAMNEDYFVYVGVLLPDRGLKQIVASASAVGTKLIIAGFGPLEDYCRKAAAEQEMIEFLGKIPYERTLELEGNAIAIIALYDPELPNNRLAAPNKLYEAMMLGRPLITTKGTLIGEFVEREGIGITVTYGDVQGLSQALEFFRSNPKECEEMGRRARTLYETQYSFRKQREKLKRAYQELCPEMFARRCSTS